MSEQWIDVIPAVQCMEGEHYVIVTKGRPIAVYNLQGTFYAIEDCCTHQNLPLSDGIVENGVITCPFHGAKFNIKTGAVTEPPAFENLQTYAVRVWEGMVQVKV